MTAVIPQAMTVNYRALIAWFLLLVFIVFLVVRLDEKVSWNWFIVFIPMWLLDVLIVIYVAIYMVRHCTSGVDPSGRSMLRKVGFLVCVGLKILFEVLICLRVEYLSSITAYVVAIPIWVLLIVAVCDVTHSVLHRAWPNCICPSVVCKRE